MTQEPKDTLKNEIFTVPNILVFLRIILVPVFVYLYMSESYYSAFIVMAVAFFTDFLDGKIARKFNCITDLGKTIDPIADKLYQFAVAVCLIASYPAMLSTAVILFVKEISMGVLGIILLNRGGKIFSAKWYGKLCSCVLYFTMIFLIVAPLFNYSVPDSLSSLLIGLCDGLLIFAGIMYIRLYFSKLKELGE